MIQQTIQKQIITIWDKYIADNKKVLDTKGNDLDNIDEKRIEAIATLKITIEDFLIGKIDIAEFKTDIDSFNKQNNYWGFTSIKGQMFFNLLLKSSESEEQNKKLTKLLKDCITEPKNLTEALSKVEAMDKYTSAIFNKAPDKRKTPNPGSVCYFLSYFWQIHNYQQWPVMFSSIIVSFTDIGLWAEPTTYKEAYNTFYNLNEEIKQILSKHTGRSISNWEAEHCFWNFRTITAYPKTTAKTKDDKVKEAIADATVSALKVASFNINTYLLPVISNLVELGSEIENSSAAKGSKFEKAVCEVFKQLGFNVQQLGQGTGREPDLIAIHKEENVAFIVDAKAYANGYMMGAADERAIKEYISHYCPKLQKDGIKKIGFLIVSNAFKSDFANFINEITWKTDIKRFSLLTSDALLHLLAYKSKDQLHLSEIIEAIISLGTSISAQDIIQKFDDI
jgi:Restriction endonuclease FokI, C terminal